ncbi:MAG TPA: 4Fe-4S binding protein [Anaerolineae bacterium]|nr:4Fe-4S binding protein [Anaerolineae bacterium]
MIAWSGYVTVVDEALCAGCGSCADVCQFAAISVDDDHARTDAAACMGCGVYVARQMNTALPGTILTWRCRGAWRGRWFPQETRPIHV